MFTPRLKPSRLTSMKARRRTLEPGRRHPAVFMPDGRKAVPVAGIAPEHPVLDDLADGALVVAVHRSYSRWLGGWRWLRSVWAIGWVAGLAGSLGGGC